MEELIREYIDQAAIKAQTDFFINELSKAEAAFTKLANTKIDLGIANSIKTISPILIEAKENTNNLILSQKNLAAAEKIAAIERKRYADEIVQQSKIAAANLKLQQIEIKKKEIAEKEANETGKISANEAVQRGKEKIILLRQEQEEQEKLDLIEHQRRKSALQNRNLGSFELNQGDNTRAEINKPIPKTNTPFIPVGEMQIAIAESLRLQNVIKGLDNELKANEKAFKDGSISAEHYQKKIVENTIASNKYKNDLALVTKEIKIGDDAYKQLSARFDAAALKAKSFSASLGATHPTTLAAVQDAKNLSTQLKTIDESVGQNQRNVGNYTNSIVKAGGSIFSAVRKIAFILPGFGIAGIFGLIFEGISSVVSKLDIFNSKLTETQKNAKDLQEVSKNAGDIGAGDIAHLELLRSKITDLSAPMSDRLKAVKAYNDLAEDGNKIDVKQIEQTGYLNSQIERQTELIGKRAIAKAYENKLTEAASLLFDADQKVKGTGYGKEIEDLDKLNDAIDKNQKQNLKGKKLRFLSKQEEKDLERSGISADQQQDIIARNTRFEKQRQDLIQLKKTSEYKEYIDAKENFERIKKLAVDNIDVNNIITPDKAKKAPKAAASKESNKEIFDVDFADQKRNLQRKITLLDGGVNDEKNSFDKRISLLNEFSTESNNLIDLEASQERKKLQEKLDITNANIKKAKGTEKNNLTADAKDLANRIKDIDNKAADDKLKIADTHEKRFNELVNKSTLDYLAKQKAKSERVLQLLIEEKDKKKAAIDTQYSEDVKLLNARYLAGEISQEDFNKKRARLDIAYHIKSLQNEIEYAKKLIDIQLLTVKDISKEKSKLVDLEKQLSDISVKNFTDAELKKIAAVKETLDTIKQVGEKVFEVIGGIINAQTISQKNALREQQDSAEKKAARDIELVNASTISEQDKAAKILIINARLAAQKEQFARKEREVQLQQARFDKAKSIFEITINTAIAVSKALAKGNILEAIAFGVFGAAQLAIAIATPLPKFKHGKGAGNNYEGLAIVGDGGKKEIIERSDGRIEITPATDTLTHIGKNDIVHPDAAAWMTLIHGAAQRDATRGFANVGAANSPVDITGELKKQSRLLTQIATKKELHLSGSGAGMQAIWKWGAQQTTYVNESTNW